MKLVDNIMDIALAVSCNDIVSINYSALRSVAALMKDNPLEEKQVDEHKIKKALTVDSRLGRELVLKELVSDAVNYCYWIFDSGVRPNGAGSTMMRQLLEQSFDARLAMNSRLDLVAQLRKFHKRMMISRFPLMDKRREHLYALARPLMVYGASNVSAHQTSNTVAHIVVRDIALGIPMDQMLDFLISEVDGYGDDPFLKRAFLFFIQLNRVFGIYEEEVQKLPVPVDYQVPKMLNHYQILDYSEELAAKIDQGVHLPENGPEEMAIRAATMIACRDLGDITGWSAADVDGWFFTRRNETGQNFHLTITSNY